MAQGVVVDFTANLARFTSSIDKATNDLNKFQSNTKRISQQINNSLAGLGVGISVLGFGSFIKSSIDALDKLNDLNKSTGISVERLSGLSLAAQQSGTDLDGVAQAINKLSVNIGNDTEKFAKLGITAKDPLEAFKQLADVFVAIKDPQERAAVAAAALGKSWQSAAPLLAEGGKRLGEIVEQGTKASGVTKEAAEQADKFNDQLAELKILSSGVGIAIATELLPSINAAIRDFQLGIKHAGGFGSALLAIGLIDPFKNGQQNIRIYSEELEKLEKKRSAGPETFLGKANEKETLRRDERIELLKVRIGYLKELAQQEALALGKGFENYKIPSSREADGKKLDTSGFLGGDSKAKSNADKLARERQKIFDENRKQEEQNRRVEFDIEGSVLDGKEDAFIKQRDRIADLKKEFTDLIDPVEKYRVKLNEIDEAQQAGALSADQANEARFKINDAIDAQLKFNEVTKETDDLAKELGLTFTSAFEDALVGGKDVRSVVQSLAQDLLKLTIRKSLTEPLFEAAAAALKFAQAGNSSSSSSGLFGSIISGIGAFFGGGAGGGGAGGGFGGAATIAAANGGVFGGKGGLSAYSGSIVSSPTLFKFASGTGLMGEAGPEAILPLKRGSDGKLGVRLAGGGSGGGVTVNNYYNIDASGADVGVEDRLRRALRESEERAVNRSVSQVQNLNQRGLLRVS